MKTTKVRRRLVDETIRQFYDAAEYLIDRPLLLWSPKLDKITRQLIKAVGKLKQRDEQRTRQLLSSRNEHNFMATKTLADLTNDELAERVCMLDMLEMIAAQEDIDQLEFEIGMQNPEVRIQKLGVHVHEMRPDQLKEQIDRELKRRIEFLRSDTDTLVGSEQERAELLEMLAGMEAEDIETCEFMEWPNPTVRVMAADMTNEQVRQWIYREAVAHKAA